MKENKEIIKSLYIHIPFCDHICSYCDFKKMVCSNDLKEKYIKSLNKELEYKSELFSNLETIYIGGGTPSSLPFNFLYLLLNNLKELINLNKLKEFTFEMNPNDINKENINTWINLFKKYNINRLSLGIQSFNNKKLKLMNRNHDKLQAINCLKLLKKHNFNNVNIDLLYGFTFDTFSKIKKDINFGIKYGIKHISYYSLILEENTILHHKYIKNEFEMLDDDKEAILYNKIYKYLLKKGFNRYEISNFSLASFESIHNLRVWNNEHYLACGVSGSYYIGNIRYTNISSVTNYINYINNDNYGKIISECIELDKDDIIDEEIMLGLRKEEGININTFYQKYNISVYDKYPNIIELVNNKLLIIENNYLKIDPLKMYLQNYILGEIFKF